MRTQLSNYLDNVITGLLFLVATLTPLFFLPMMTDTLDTPKLYLLAGIVLIILPLKALQWLILGRIYLNFTPLDLPLLALIGGLYISTFLSPTRFNSFLGEAPSLHGGFISWVLYILLFFIMVNHIRTRNKYNLVILGLISGVALSATLYLVSRISYLELPNTIYDIRSIPFDSSLPILITLISPILVTLILKAEGLATPLFSSLALSVSSAAFILSGNYLVFLPLILTSLFLILSKPPRLDTLPKLSPLRLQLLTLPLVVGVIMFVIPGTTRDPDSSWIPAFAGMTESFPSLILHNSYFIIPLIPALLVIFTALRILTNRSSHKEPVDYAISFSALTAVLSLPFFISHISYLISLALLISLKLVQYKTSHSLIYSLPLRQLALIIFLLIGSVGIIGGVRVVKADLANAKGLASSDKPQQSYTLFSEAVTLVPLSDLYRANLALSAFSYAQSIAEIYQSANNSQSTVDGQMLDADSSPIRQRDEALIKSLLDESLLHSKKAAELNPLNYQNYLLLGFLQSRMAKINIPAFQEAYQSYLKVLEIEPNSRELPFQIASLYYSSSEFKLAAEFFQKAVERDPNWANAHYNLGLTFKELQEVEKAKAEISVAMRLLNPQSIDFKAAEGVLEGLGQRIQTATETASLNLPSETKPEEEVIPAPISGRTLIRNGKPI
jgi:cytochrome c-type biogenesis protein CcmH/NrfG